MKIKTYKMEYPRDELYYSLNRVLTIDANVYLIQSIRDLGKSYSARKLVLKNLNKGYNCAWLRWDKTETATANDKFSTSENLIKGKIPDSNVGYVMTENGNKCYFLSVKGAMSYKDFGIDNLRYVIYDECVPEHYDVKTRRETEFKKLMSLFDTIKRDSDARLIMICNCIDWFNPFTANWEIYPFNSGLVKVFDKSLIINEKRYNMRIAVENVKPSPAMINRVAQLQVLKGNAKTVKDYFDNVATTQYNLIGTCPDLDLPLEPIQLRIKDNYYSHRKYNGVFYFCKTGKRDGIDTDSADVHDIRAGEYRTKEIGQTIEILINRGQIRFDTGHTYNDILTAVYKYRERL